MNARRDRAWVVPALAAHVEALAPHLRGADRREIHAAFGRPADAILRAGFGNARRCWSVLADGRPVAMFGVGRRRDPRVGTVWLLASDEFERFGSQLLREGSYWVDILMAGHDVLANFVAADNRVALRWLTWLGFELLALHRGVGTGGEDFWEFAAFRPGARERRVPAIACPSTERETGASSVTGGTAAGPASGEARAAKSRRPDRD